MKKLISFVITSTIICSMFAGCGNNTTDVPQSASSTVSSQGATSSDMRVLQLGHLDPGKDNNAYQVFCTTFKKNLNEISGGKFDIDIFSDAQLGGEREMMEGMKLGTVDMAIITNSYFSNFVPDFMVFDLPYLFADYNAAYRILDDPDVMDPLKEKLYNDCDVKFLDWGNSGFRYIVNTSRPIVNVEDLKGLKIRLPESPLYVETFKALGANPTTMAFSEAFTAVQQKTVDGLEITASAIYTAGYYEICDYLSKTNHFYSPISINMSRSIWDDLTEEEQGWFMEAAAKTKAEQRVAVEGIEKELFDEMGKAIAINEISSIEDFRDAATPAFDYARGKIGDDLVDLVLSKLS